MSLGHLKSFIREGNNKDKANIKGEEEKPANPILTAHIERERLNREAYKEIAENIKKSEKLRCKINKDFIAGTDYKEILKDCLKVISLMTGDTVFYNQNIKHLKKWPHKTPYKSSLKG